MARLYNLARVYTATTGIVNIALGAAVPGFLTFVQAGVADGQVSYGIRDGANTEVGIGVYASGSASLVRSYVLASTNAGGAISLSGNAEVYLTALAHDIAEPEGLAYNGIQVNGGMEVAQYTASGYPLDCWKTSFNSTGAVLGVGPASASGWFAGYPSLLYCSVTTPKTTLTGTDFNIVYQSIEGYRCARLAWGTNSAKPISISFWTAHYRTGIYTVSVVNSASNRSYVTTYTQAASAVPQYNTVIIPGDQIGSWTIDTGIGMSVFFTFAMGTTYAAPTLNAWQAGYYFGHSSQVNAIASTSDMFRITGVLVLPGTDAPSSTQASLVMRSYDQELLLCKRYWQQIGLIVETGAIAAGTVTYSVPMRVTPSASGGGAGFAMSNPSTVSSAFYQTTRSYQTITLDARFL